MYFTIKPVTLLPDFLFLKGRIIKNMDATRNPRRKELTPEQKRTLSVIMYGYDLALSSMNKSASRAADGSVLNVVYKPNGPLTVSNQSLRNEFEDNLITAIKNGLTVQDMVNDTGNLHIPSLGSEEQNTKLNQIMMMLDKDKGLPAPPFDYCIDNNGKNRGYNSIIFGYDLDTEDLNHTNLYVVSNNTFYVNTLDPSTPQGRYITKNIANYFTPILTQRVVCAVKDYMNNLDDAYKMHMKISDAQELDNLLKTRKTGYGYSAEAYRDEMVETASKYISEHGGDPNEFKKYCIAMESSDNTASDYLNVERIMREANNFRVAGLYPIDVFGSIVYPDSLVKSHYDAANIDVFHSFINNDKNAQIAAISTIDETFKEDVSKAGETKVYYNPDSVGMNAFVACDSTDLRAARAFFVKDGQVKNRRPDKNLKNYYVQINKNFEKVFAESEKKDDYSIGMVYSPDEYSGMSRLRKYIKSTDYNDLSVDVPESRIDCNSDTVEYLYTVINGPENDHIAARALDNATTILEELNERGLDYEIREVSGHPEELVAHIDELNLDIRIMDTQHPEMIGKCYGDNIDTMFSINKYDLSLVNSAPGKFIDGNFTSDSEIKHFKKMNPDFVLRSVQLKYKPGAEHTDENIIETKADVVYMPTKDDVLNLIRYRLGDSITVKANGYHRDPELGDKIMGVYDKEIGTAGPGFFTHMEYHVPTNANIKPAEIIASESLASYRSSGNDGGLMVEYKTFGDVPYKTVYAKDIKHATKTISISSTLSNSRNAQQLRPLGSDSSFHALEEKMVAARENFKTRVFGGIKNEIDNRVPNYKKTEWVSYRKTPNPRVPEELTWKKDEQGYLLDPDTGERIVARISSRSEELLKTAGDEKGSYGSIMMDNDPVIRELQENYINYIEHDDAILRGVVDGKIVPETMAEFNRRMEDIRESENYVDVDGEYMESVVNGGNIHAYTASEKFDHIQQQFGQFSDKMFGQIQADGSFKINVANIIKYGGFDEKEIFRLIQDAKKEHDFKFISTSDEFTMNRLNEKTVIFNPESAESIIDVKKLNNDGRLFLSHMSNVIQDTLRTSGIELDSLEMDDKGIVHYNGRRAANAGKPGKDGKPTVSMQVVDGQLGQIFEPDENGVILTKFDHNNNYAIVPGFIGLIHQGEEPFEQRIKLRGYEQVMADRIKSEIRKQTISIASTSPKNADQDNTINYGDSLSTTSLNNVYRHLNDRKLELDYMGQLLSTGLNEDEAKALIDTHIRTVSFNSSYTEESTINAIMQAEKSNFIDDMNSNGYSITGKDISITEPDVPGYFAPVETSSGKNQGKTRYLCAGATWDEDGNITPTNDPSLYDTPLMCMDICRNNKFNPPDRQEMVFSNSMQALSFDKATNIAHMTLQGWNMDDANVVSKKWAEKHLVKDKDASVTENLDPSLIKWRLRDGTTLRDHEFLNQDDYTHVEALGRDFIVNDGAMVKMRFGENVDDEELIGKTALVPAEDADNYLDVATIIEDAREYSYEEQIKEQLIANGIGIRPLVVGDKICDENGNKGVISLVVDPDMDVEKAKRLQIEDAVALFRQNPELDIVSAPFTAPSRYNAGTVRGMMFADDGITPDAKPLYIPQADGTIKEVPGAMGTIPMIITDKTVDEKSHFYDEEDLQQGKGRAASGQLIWSLYARKATKVLHSLYKDNVSNTVSVREKMIALGCDLDANGNMYDHYQPQTMANGETENRPIIKLPYDDISEWTIALNKDGKYFTKEKDPASTKQAKAEAIEMLSVTGGMMEIPFPITMGNGKELDKTEDGKYLLPVMPIQYRMEQTFDDGISMSHNYSRFYNEIAEAAINFESASRRKKIKDKNEREGKNFIESKRLSSSKYMRMAQESYNRLKAELESSFEGKYNDWKHKIMKHRLPNSATAIWTPDPRLGIDEIGMSRTRAESMGIRDGDEVLVWRDPQLRPEGAAVMTVRIRSSEDAQLQGVAINPCMDKRYDGDFDGDSVAVVSMNSLSLKERDFLDEYNATDDEDIQHSILQKYHIRNSKVVDKLQEKAKSDAEVKAEAHDKLSIVNTLEDLAQTPDMDVITDPKSEIQFCVNDGLDIASASAISKDQCFKTHIDVRTAASYGISSSKSYDCIDESGKTHKYAIVPQEEMVNAAKIAYYQGHKKDALILMNDYFKQMLKNAYGSDIVKYSNWKDYFESMNTMIVDHKAKGKIGKIEDIAAYLNVYQNGHRDGERMCYIHDDNDKKVRVDINKPFIDLVQPAKTHDKLGNYYIEANGIRTTRPIDNHIANQCDEYHTDIVQRYKQVELATAIKSIGTGTAGEFSQRAVKAQRELNICDALETTYGATQGLLQAKHSAIEAEQKYTILRETLPALWKGYSIKYDSEKKAWCPEMREDGYGFKKANRQEWIDQYYGLCHNMEVTGHDENGIPTGNPVDVGLSYDTINIKRIERFADGFYGDSNDEMPKERNAYSNEIGCTLDRLAYKGTVETMYQACHDGKNIYDTDGVSFLKPEGSIAKENRSLKVNQNEREVSASYSLEAKKVEKERTSYKDKTVPNPKHDQNEINQALNTGNTFKEYQNTTNKIKANDDQMVV